MNDTPPREPEEIERLVNERIGQIRETEEPSNVHALPTRPDQLLAAIHDSLKIMREIAAAAEEVAAMRKRMFDAYLAAGFAPDQALTMIIQRQPL